MRNIHMGNYDLDSAWVPKLIMLSIIVDTIAMLEILSGEAIKEEAPIFAKASLVLPHKPSLPPPPCPPPPPPLSTPSLTSAPSPFLLSPLPPPPPLPYIPPASLIPPLPLQLLTSCFPRHPSLRPSVSPSRPLSFSLRPSLRTCPSLARLLTLSLHHHLYHCLSLYIFLRSSPSLRPRSSTLPFCSRISHTSLS